MATLDVLVCGQCHSAFHFVEEFKEHKDANNCTGKSPVRDSVSVNYINLTIYSKVARAYLKMDYCMFL